MRIDEGGCEHETGRIDHPMLIRVDLLADRGDDAVIDAYVEPRIDPSRRIEHAGATEDHVRLLLLACPEHQATSAAASARTPTGPPVRTS